MATRLVLLFFVDFDYPALFMVVVSISNLQLQDEGELDPGTEGDEFRFQEPLTATDANQFTF